MDRRHFMGGSLAGLAALSLSTVSGASGGLKALANGGPLKPPSDRRIRVGVAIAEQATVIDFAGPWEVFQDVMLGGDDHASHTMPFELYTVAATARPVRATGGLQIIPDHTVDSAPDPDVIVIPALKSSGPLLDWIAAAAPASAVTMSVCTGAFQLARTGLLDGLPATTHHDFYDRFAREFPTVRLERNMRFVDNGRLASAGGLTSGIDLALRVVERYFGANVAQRTADYMEYTGEGWKAGRGAEG